MSLLIFSKMVLFPYLEILSINNVNDTFSYGAVLRIAFQSLLNLLELWLLSLAAQKAWPEALGRAGAGSARSPGKKCSGLSGSQQYLLFRHSVPWAVFIDFLPCGVYWLNLCEQIEILFPLGHITVFFPQDYFCTTPSLSDESIQIALQEKTSGGITWS